ncbi:hypothetical protein V4V35_23640 [Bacillus infantis]|uniref:hypothetical protein n=1 Tax=Bacillus infantis TaxID=324767 RepID=UPI002FBF1313
MFILTAEQNYIIHITDKVERRDERVFLEHENTIITHKVNIYEVNVIPEDIKPYEYSYTEDNGFFLTPPPPDPQPEPASEVDLLKEENALLWHETLKQQAALAGLEEENATLFFEALKQKQEAEAIKEENALLWHETMTQQAAVNEEISKLWYEVMLK